MKRATFRLSNGDDATGWQTSVPGLVAWRGEGGKLWALMHAPTGRFIAHFSKREDVERAAVELEPLTDWTETPRLDPVLLDEIVAAIGRAHEMEARKPSPKLFLTAKERAAAKENAA